LENPDICGVVVNVRDITERKQAEDKIRQTLKEKETLLKEIHHRVKNNMSVISGLLYLMSDRIEDETMKGLFEESRQWIKSMALVHEKIYRTENLARIDFSDYIHSLVHDLLSSYHAKGREISTKINVRDIVLDINTAIPCGQIINELITNAMKYAFPEKTGGEIGISFTKTDHVYTLIVKDNGIGLPVGFDHTKTNTLGLQLVDALTRQLRGTLQFRSDAAARQGTEVIITFREKDRGAQL
jgi:two-component sensor histidine kinase